MGETRWVDESVGMVMQTRHLLVLKLREVLLAVLLTLLLWIVHGGRGCVGGVNGWVRVDEEGRKGRKHMSNPDG